MPNAFQAVSGRLDLAAATRRGSDRNDLLPPRPEDRVVGEVGKRFSDALASRLSRGKYDPTPAEFVSVPKPGHTTRPAALLTLTDRIVYDALVEALRTRIDGAMVGPAIAHWPRGVVSEKQWRQFEAAPIDGGSSYVALADVTAFYETVDHERLRETLTDLAGQREVVDALVEFLGRVMRSHRGLPQGLAASDALATAYLTPLDHAMARECLVYHRHGDDIRIGAKSFGDAKRAVNLLENQLRRRLLVLNGAKAIIMHADGYRATLDDGDRATLEARKALLEERVGALQEDGDELMAVLNEAGRQDLGWEFFYHGSLSFDEMVTHLAEHLTKSEVDVAAVMFRGAMERRPGTAEPLSPEAFHHRVTFSLMRLAAGKSAVALPYARALIAVAPEKTEVVATYLMALPASEDANVLEQVMPLLSDGMFRTAWEKAWLLRVIGHAAPSLDAANIAVLNAIAADEDETPMARVEALKVLSSLGYCDRLIVRRLWNTASAVFHPDLVQAVRRASAKVEWCAAFLEGVKEDPVNVVVLKHMDGAV